MIRHRGVIQGYGRYQYKNGNVYVGSFVKSMREGRGKITYCDGTVYEGEYHNNSRNGRGTFYYSNGNSVVLRLESNSAVHIMYSFPYVAFLGDIYAGEWLGNADRVPALRW